MEMKNERGTSWHNLEIKKGLYPSIYSGTDRRTVVLSSCWHNGRTKYEKSVPPDTLVQQVAKYRTKSLWDKQDCTVRPGGGHEAHTSPNSTDSPVRQLSVKNIGKILNRFERATENVFAKDPNMECSSMVKVNDALGCCQDLYNAKKKCVLYSQQQKNSYNIPRGWVNTCLFPLTPGSSRSFIGPVSIWSVSSPRARSPLFIHGSRTSPRKIIVHEVISSGPSTDPIVTVLQPLQTLDPTKVKEVGDPHNRHCLEF